MVASHLENNPQSALFLMYLCPSRIIGHAAGAVNSMQAARQSAEPEAESMKAEVDAVVARQQERVADWEAAVAEEEAALAAKQQELQASALFCVSLCCQHREHASVTVDKARQPLIMLRTCHTQAPGPLLLCVCLCVSASEQQCVFGRLWITSSGSVRQGSSRLSTE